VKLQLAGFKTQFNGTTVLVDVFFDGRTGTKAPTNIYYRFKNRWITEFERQHRNWREIDGNDLLRIIYSTELKELVYKDNPLLAMIPKYTDFNGSLYPIPIIFKQSIGVSCQKQ
jgi:hypothetical protein